MADEMSRLAICGLLSTLKGTRQILTRREAERHPALGY
jgi:hypothetical protein